MWLMEMRTDLDNRGQDGAGRRLLSCLGLQSGSDPEEGWLFEAGEMLEVQDLYLCSFRVASSVDGVAQCRMREVGSGVAPAA